MSQECGSSFSDAKCPGLHYWDEKIGSVKNELDTRILGKRRLRVRLANLKDQRAALQASIENGKCEFGPVTTLCEEGVGPSQNGVFFDKLECGTGLAPAEAYTHVIHTEGDT